MQHQSISHVPCSFLQTDIRYFDNNIHRDKVPIIIILSPLKRYNQQKQTTFFLLQNVLFYLVSDDLNNAKTYVFTEKNDNFNIILPYNGTIKVPGK